MYQKDYILRVIEACSDALAKIIGLKEKGKNKLALEEIKKVYDEMLKIDIDQILNSSLDKLEGIESEKLEIISDLLKVEGKVEFEEGNEQKTILLFKKSLEILVLVDEKQTTFSFERKNKITELKNLLKNN